MPEGIGNTLFVLPRGVVCDRCNNGPLSVVDQTFLNFAPVALMRVTQGVLTKSGVFPHMRFANASVERVDANNVHVHVGGRKNVKPIPGGFNASFEGRRMTPKYTAQVTRFLFKAALEFTYVDQGREVAVPPEVRRGPGDRAGAAVQGVPGPAPERPAPREGFLHPLAGAHERPGDGPRVRGRLRRLDGDGPPPSGVAGRVGSGRGCSESVLDPQLGVGVPAGHRVGADSSWRGRDDERPRPGSDPQDPQLEGPWQISTIPYTGSHMRLMLCR